MTRPVTAVLLLVVLCVHLAAGAGPAAARGLPGAAQPVGVWPLQPQPAVVHDFAPPAQPWGSGHRGVDLAGRVGQSVHAALAGRVSFVGRIAGVGVVVVDHGATRTTYQPVAAVVSAGAPVAAGAPIGRLTWSGTHCLPTACLHWGLRRGSAYLDPLTLVGGGPRPVRLLTSRAEPPFLRSAPLLPPAEPPFMRSARAAAGAAAAGVRPVGAPGGRPSAVAPW